MKRGSAKTRAMGEIMRAQKPEESSAPISMWYCALSKFSRKLSEVGRTTQYAKDMPIASSPIAAVTSLTTERSAWGEKAGARNAHACQRTTGSESASAVQKQMLNETMKG